MTLAKTQTHITSPSHSALGSINSEIAPKKHPNSVSGSAQEAKELPPGNWERVILRLRSRDEPDKRGPPMVSIIGTGDPDTIPEEWWKLTPEEEAMWAEEEEVPEPLHETDDEAAEPALIAKPVSPPGRHAPPRPPRGSRFKPLTLNEIALLPPRSTALCHRTAW